MLEYRHQIGEGFNALAATTVTVTDVGDPNSDLPPAMSFPTDARERITQLNGAIDAGTYFTPNVRPEPAIGATPPRAAGARGVSGVTLVAVDTGIFTVTGIHLVSGRLWAEFVQERCVEPLSAPERLLVLVPDSVEPRQLQEAFTACKSATLISGKTNGITICVERGPRPLEVVADEIVQRQELYRQLAERLHTREDVDWGPLAPPRAESHEVRFDDIVVRTP